MPKVNIKVVVRLRPVNKSTDLLSTTEESVNVKTKQNMKSYKFNKVFNQDTKQQQLYSQAGVDELVKHVADGYNSTVFAFGQTSAGKTYTMEGYQYDTKTLKPMIEHNKQGVIQRAIKSLYHLANKKDNLVSISCSFLQIYNQKLYDLLKPMDMDNSLKLRWDKENQFSVQNLSDIICHNDNQMIKIWQEGIKKRIVASNNLNIASSRSHTIFRINIQTKQNDVSYYSRLQLVDLAGSQRSGDSKPTKQSIEINKSLFTLKKVINSLEASEPYIPYRQSKLTSLLKHSVGGNSYCLIIACINPADQCIEHTISTLNYASKAKTIMNSIQQIINTKDKVILSLKRQNEILREQLRVAQKQIQVLSKLQERKNQRSIKIPNISPSHLGEMHNNISPSPQYFSQRLVQSINTVRELLKSNKLLRDDLDKSKQKVQSYAQQISNLVYENEQLKNICMNKQTQQTPTNNRCDYKIKRLSVGKILQRQKTFRDQLHKSNHKRVSTQYCEIPQQMNISLPRFNRS